MVETITTTLQDELEAQHFDEPIRERLSACLPVLEQAIAGWRANHAFSPPGLMITGATPRSGVVVHAAGWGEPLDEFDHELAVRAVAKAVELPVSTESNLIITLGLSVALGAAGRRAQAKDAGHISRFGDLPLPVVSSIPACWQPRSGYRLPPSRARWRTN